MQSNDEGGAEHYQDSDNADSPADDSGADDDDHTVGKKRKKNEREIPYIFWTLCCQC